MPFHWAVQLLRECFSSESGLPMLVSDQSRTAPVLMQISLMACNLGSFGCHKTRTHTSEIPLMLPTNSTWDQTTSSSKFPITRCCCVLNTYRSNSVAAPEYTSKLFLALKENCSLVFLPVAQLGIK